VTTILESLKVSKSKDKRDERAVREVFVEVDQAPEMIAGLQFFLKKAVSKTEIVEQTEKETVRWACKSIMDMLTKVLATTTLQED
jgi:nucleolar MIF4G domain-containing protein 1